MKKMLKSKLKGSVCLEAVIVMPFVMYSMIGLLLVIVLSFAMANSDISKGRSYQFDVPGFTQTKSGENKYPYDVISYSFDEREVDKLYGRDGSTDLKFIDNTYCGDGMANQVAKNDKNIYLRNKDGTHVKVTLKKCWLENRKMRKQRVG